MNRRKEGESIKQWRDRLKQQTQGIYMGELEPAVIIEPSPAIISQGYQTVGRKNNDHRVGQKSLFGEREYDAYPSLAQRFGNWITDGLHLTSPPTHRDGYDRTMNSEVSTWESAQGQELKRMGKTAMFAGTAAALPFGLHQFYVNPLAMAAAVGSGVAIDQGTKAALNVANDKLNDSGKQLSENQKNAIRAAVGLFSGNKAYKWGDRATKRGLEVAMHTTGATDPTPLIIGGWKQRNWNQRKDILKYILTGKNTNNNSNTLGYLLEGEPTFYTGLYGVGNSAEVPKYGYDAVRTYLYGEPLKPFKVPSDQSLGVHAKYVADNYPSKNIKVYETITAHPSSVNPTSTGSEEAAGYLTTMEPLKDSFKWYDFDAAGHMIENGAIGNDRFIREQDIWKFNSGDYMKRWGDEHGGLKRFMTKWALDVVDHHGNPFIVRTPWMKAFGPSSGHRMQ